MANTESSLDGRVVNFWGIYDSSGHGWSIAREWPSFRAFETIYRRDKVNRAHWTLMMLTLDELEMSFPSRADSAAFLLRRHSNSG